MPYPTTASPGLGHEDRILDNAPALDNREDAVYEEERLEAKLDDALLHTFPASDAFCVT